MGVLLFQILVACSIVVLWALFDRLGAVIAAVGWTVATFAAVHADWLVVVQCVVAWSMCIFLPTRPPQLRRLMHETARRVAIAAAACIAVGFVVVVVLDSDDRASRSPRPAVATRQHVPPAAPERCEDSEDVRELIAHGMSRAEACRQQWDP